MVQFRHLVCAPQSVVNERYQQISMSNPLVCAFVPYRFWCCIVKKNVLERFPFNNAPFFLGITLFCRGKMRFCRATKVLFLSWLERRLICSHAHASKSIAQLLQLFCAQICLTWLFHIRVCHTQLVHTEFCHTQLVQIEFFDTHLCHTQLFHTICFRLFSLIFPAFPIPVSHLFRPCWKKLTCGVFWSLKLWLLVCLEAAMICICKGAGVAPVTVLARKRGSGRAMVRPGQPHQIDVEKLWYFAGGLDKDSSMFI